MTLPLFLPRIVAHRGASAEAPENTLPAFRRAVALGVQAFEFDVHLTRDEQPVVIHDAYVDRTTDGTGSVHDMTLDEVRALDAGSWFGDAFAGERVPTLREVLALAHDAGVGVNVEIKSEEGEPAGLVDVVGRALGDAGMAGRAFVSSFDPVVVERFRAKYADVAGTGVILFGVLEPEHLRDYGPFADAFGLYVDCASPEAAQAVHDAKKKLVAWTVNDLPRAKHLLESGVDSVITDDPAALTSLV